MVVDLFSRSIEKPCISSRYFWLPFKMTCVCPDPLYPLHVRSVERGFAVHRNSDGATVAQIVVRDVDSVVHFQWDSSTGRFFALFHRDGSLRIYDAFKKGRLVAFLRAGSRTTVCDSGLWDRLEIPVQDPEVRFETDIIQDMPGPIRFAKTDVPLKLTMTDYSRQHSNWRSPDPSESAPVEKNADRGNVARHVDLQIFHHIDPDQFTLLFNGDYSIMLPESQINYGRLCKIIGHEGGLYWCFYHDFATRLLDISLVLTSETALPFIETLISLREFHHYISYHLDLVRAEYVSPYSTMHDSLCQKSIEPTVLFEDLQSLLLVGEISPTLQTWLHDTVGKENFNQWKQLGMKSYDKIRHVSTLALIPACERLLILAERTRGILRTVDSDTVDFAPVTRLIMNLQSVLEIALEGINALSDNERSFMLFTQWLEDQIKLTSTEGYQPTFALDGTPTTAHELLNFMQRLMTCPASNQFSFVSRIDAALSAVDENIANLQATASSLIATQEIDLKDVGNSGPAFQGRSLLDIIKLPETMLLPGHPAPDSTEPDLACLFASCETGKRALAELEVGLARVSTRVGLEVTNQVRLFAVPQDLEAETINQAVILPPQNPTTKIKVNLFTASGRSIECELRADGTRDGSKLTFAIS